MLIDEVLLVPLNQVTRKIVDLMHQSIPTAPCPPPLPGNCVAFAPLVNPGGGALANLARPGGRAFANPRHNPEKFVDVFKGMFS